ncbi:hypothetical protein E2562_031996 [Oryza meyeriana var. granulata]|uniref:Uncharacterized protein n=1 Tax=Oryza meyeriana var. granulata TaxID=110450 RepID=A0A6G1FEC2_9ORYZ|nr:hypothetical protein E2562_031996 [Oryza meyeriana var. granulata]
MSGLRDEGVKDVNYDFFPFLFLIGTLAAARALHPVASDKSVRIPVGYAAGRRRQRGGHGGGRTRRAGSKGSGGCGWSWETTAPSPPPPRIRPSSSPAAGRPRQPQSRRGQPHAPLRHNRVGRRDFIRQKQSISKELGLLGVFSHHGGEGAQPEDTASGGALPEHVPERGCGYCVRCSGRLSLPTHVEPT